MGPIACPETSAINYQSTLRNIPAVRRSEIIYLNIGYSVLSEVKINPVVKIQSYGNKRVQRVGRWTETDGLPHLVIKPRMIPKKTSRLLLGPEQVMMHKTMQAVMMMMMMMMMMILVIQDFCS